MCVDPAIVTGLLPSDDTYIDAGKPIDILGADVKFQVRPDNGADRRGLLKFDLSGIPANATIVSATLYLYESGNKIDQVTNIYPITTDWSEGTATWLSPWLNAGGDFNSSISYAVFIPNQNNCNISLDITNLTQLWVNQTYPNYGMLLYSTGPNHIIEYPSKEDLNNPDRAPRLEVSYLVNTKPAANKFSELFVWIKNFLEGFSGG